MLASYIVSVNSIRSTKIEVTDSRTGYFIPVRYGIGVWPDGRVVVAAAVVGVLWKFRSTFLLGNYIRRCSYGFRVQERDIWTWRPGFYSEFRCKSYEHSGLAWEAILRTFLVLTIFPRLPCSFFQEHVPNMIFFPKRPRQQGAFKYGPNGPYMDLLPEIYMDRTVHIWTFYQVFKIVRSSIFPGSHVIIFICICRFQYFQVPRSSTWIVFQYFQVPRNTI